MPKIIGLTGGIGSGKSTVADFFSALDVPVYIADDHAKKIMDYPEVIQEIQAIFEQNIIDQDGKLNRKKIASIVFNQPEQLTQLNAIVHPRVKEDFMRWIKEHQNHPFVIKEVAILFENQSEKEFDEIILVTAPEEQRIGRVMKRDNISKEEVLERIQNQLPDREKISKSHYVINNVNLDKTQKEVKKIYKTLSKS